MSRAAGSHRCPHSNVSYKQLDIASFSTWSFREITNPDSPALLSAVGSASTDARSSPVRRDMVRATSASLEALRGVKTSPRATSIWWSIWIERQDYSSWKHCAGSSRRYLASLLTLFHRTVSDLGFEKRSSARPPHYELAPRRRAPRRHRRRDRRDQEPPHSWRTLRRPNFRRCSASSDRNWRGRQVAGSPTRRERARRQVV